MATKIYKESMMGRPEWIALLMERAGISRGQADIVMRTIAAEVGARLCRGERVRIYGLGLFYPKVLGKRPVRNPKTGEEITLPERQGIKFKPFEALTDMVKAALPLP